MEKSKDFRDLPGKEHLKKDFSAELNYKLWITRGARFVATKRLQKKNTLSAYSIGFLSGYIIIINLFGFLPNKISFYSSPNILSIVTISLSILVLIFSQLENSKNYNLRADHLHRCAMEIGKLYNEWRYYKTLEYEKIDLNEKIKDLTKRYELVLEKYGNHEDVDTMLFKAKHKDYFKFSKLKVAFAHLNFYTKVYLTYHILIFLPPIIFVYSLL